jgi:hypothetical protein
MGGLTNALRRAGIVKNPDAPAVRRIEEATW